MATAGNFVHLWCVLVLGSISLLRVGDANASANDLDDVYQLTLEELQQVTVSGSTLTDQYLEQVPSSVTVFSHAELSSLPFDTLTELMQLVPGFQSYRSSSTSTEQLYSVRGRRIGTSGSEVLVMVDGIRIEEPRVSGGVAVVSTFPLDAIERIEFIRGPGAALYGSNAMTGLINIITRKQHQKLGLTYGSFNAVTADFATHAGKGDWQFDLYSRYHQDDGDYYSVIGRFDDQPVSTRDPYSRLDINLKVQWRNTAFAMQNYRLEGHDYFELEAVNNQLNHRNVHFRHYELSHEFNYAAVASSLKFGYTNTDLTLQAQLGAQGTFSAISEPASDAALQARLRALGFEEYRALWRNDWRLSDETSLQYGAEYRYLNSPVAWADFNYDFAALLRGQFPIASFSRRVSSLPVQRGSEREILGLYGQLQQQLGEQTQLTVGMRYDRFSSIDSRLSPRFSLVHQFTQNHWLKVLFGEAFRAPSEQELNLINNPSTLGNPGLQAETVTSYEAIWYAKWPQVQMQLGYFENHFDNAIQQVIAANAQVNYLNTELEPSKGVEWEVAAQIASRWRVRFNFSHLTDKPDISFREADDTVGVAVTYYRHNWILDLTASYAGEREVAINNNLNDRVTLDDYFLLNAKWKWHINNQWQLQLQGKSLLDEDTYSPHNNASLMRGIPNRGFEAHVGIEWRYNAE